MAARSHFLLGGLAAALALTGGLFLWQGLSQDADEMALPAPPPVAGLPKAGPDAPRFGAPPPALPEAKRTSREEQRFNRYDRDRNERVSRIEMMATRSGAFRKLDRDGNNLLSFEEWAAATSERFAGADGDKSGDLTRSEFATTAPKRSPAPACKC
jgi:EF hand